MIFILGIAQQLKKAYMAETFCLFLTSIPLTTMNLLFILGIDDDF